MGSQFFKLSELSNSFIVGEYRVERELNALSCRGEQSIVEPKVMELLCYLARHAGQVISRQQLMDEVWESQVSEGAINRVVGLLRKAFADSADSPLYIQTVAKKGYRLIAEVSEIEQQAAQKTNSITPLSWLFNKNEKATLAVLLILTVLVISIFTLFVWDDNTSYSPSPAGVKALQFEQLTSDKGFELDGSLSKDGQWLVYRHRKSADQPYHLYLKKIPQQKVIQLTDTVFDDRVPSFSDDKRKVVFFRKGNNSCYIHLLDLDVEGNPNTSKALYQCGAVEHYSNVVWSQDNQSLYFTDRANNTVPYQIYQLHLDTAKVDEITGRENNYYGDNELALSPSGEKLLFFRNKYWGNNQVFIKDLLSKQQRKLTELGFLSWNPSWTADERSIIYSDNRIGGRLNKLNIESGDIETLYQSAQAINYPELSADGKHVIYSTETADVDLWQSTLTFNDEQGQLVPRLSNKARVSFNSSQIDSQPVYTKDGRALLFISSRNGAMQLWRHDEKGLNVLNALPDNVAIESYSWHPDGVKAIVATSDKQLFFINTELDKLITLPLSDQTAAFPFFSNDGKTLYFSSDKNGDWQIWGYNINNQSVKQITQAGGYQVKQGEENDKLYFTKYRQKGIWQIDLLSLEEQQLVADTERSDNFSVCKNAIFYLLKSNEIELWRKNLSTDKQEQLMTLGSDTRLKFDSTENCQQLVYSIRENIGSDIMMLHLVTQ